MIFYPVIVPNQIGSGGGNVAVTAVSDVNAFTQVVATDQPQLNNISIQVVAAKQSDAFNQLSEPFILTTRNVNGEGTTETVVPETDPYKLQAVLKNIQVQNFRLDGLSSIGYNVAPNTTVVMKLQMDKNEVALSKYYKELMGAKSTFDTIKDIPVPSEYKENEEVVNGKPLLEMIKEVNQTSDTVIDSSKKKFQKHQLRQKRYLHPSKHQHQEQGSLYPSYFMRSHLLLKN